MKLSKRSLIKLIREAIDDMDNVIDFPFKSAAIKSKRLDDLPVKHLPGEDLASMIDAQLSNLVYKNGDDSYRDDFLVTLNRVLRKNAIDAYMDHVSEMLISFDRVGDVLSHPDLRASSMEDLRDLVEDFLMILSDNPSREYSAELGHAALSVVDILESLGYDLKPNAGG